MVVQALTLRQVRVDARHLAALVVEHYGRRAYHLIAIPRGGVSVACLVAAELENQHGCTVGMSLPSEHVRATSGDVKVIVVDDILVTGATMARVLGAGEASSGAVLYIKGNPYSEKTVLHAAVADKTLWVQFPWEVADEDLGKPEDAVRRLIEYLGEDPTEEDLLDTPRRVLRFYDELREMRDTEITGTMFSSTTQDLIITSGMPFASLCRHHMLPYFGEASVAYVPHGEILGLSKSARAVQQAAGGLTVQEHITAQVAEQVKDWTKSEDVAVVTMATHLCMTMRGAKAVGSRTSASAMLGMFRESFALRAEFFAVLREAKSLA